MITIGWNAHAGDDRDIDILFQGIDVRHDRQTGAGDEEPTSALAALKMDSRNNSLLSEPPDVAKVPLAMILNPLSRKRGSRDYRA
ncbi:hypothetical protein [Bradyrhizobium sp. B120]|uniref:hypothetical protein n=1 Tax=Bradyrhizobium sp. B120 TaxID=3410088 RepID=UPI003B986DA4